MCRRSVTLLTKFLADPTFSIAYCVPFMALQPSSVGSQHPSTGSQQQFHCTLGCSLWMEDRYFPCQQQFCHCCSFGSCYWHLLFSVGFTNSGKLVTLSRGVIDTSYSIKANRAAKVWDEQTLGSFGTVRRFTEVLHLNLCLSNISSRAVHPVPGTYLNSGFLSAYRQRGM